MLTFPTLKTGSVVQYPFTVSDSFATEVLQFLAGDEQRYLTTAGSLRSWHIKLDRLDEAELESIEAFFVAASGQYATFTFVDPSSGTSYPNCFVAEDTLREIFSGELSANVSVLIQQGRT